jgi:trk system potassium uptake protein
LQTLIAGAGKIGAKVAIFLSRSGENVRVVEQDAARSEWLSKNSDATVYKGSALDPAILLDAGLDKADTLIVTLGSDELTLKLVDFAKSQFGVQKVIAVSNSSEFTETLMQRGADRVVCAEDQVLKELESVLQKGDAERTIFADKQNNYKISRTMVRATSRVLGKRALKIERGNARLSGIVRGGKLFFPDEQTTLEMGDELFITGEDRAVEKVANMVLREAG